MRGMPPLPRICCFFRRAQESVGRRQSKSYDASACESAPPAEHYRYLAPPYWDTLGARAALANEHRRRTRAIPIPFPRSSRRQPGEQSFPGPGVDPFAVPHTQPSFPTRSRLSHEQQRLAEPSSLLFEMDPEPPAYSYTTQDAPTFLYEPPRFARRQSSGHVHRCRRCGQSYNPSHASTSRPQDVCERCRGQAAQHTSTHQRPNPALAAEYIPAWHRSDAFSDDALQASYSSAEPPRPVHYYQQPHGVAAPVPRRPLAVSPSSSSHAAMSYRPAGTAVPLPPPQPSTYHVSRLQEQMRHAEEQFAAASQAGRSRSASAAPHPSQYHYQSMDPGSPFRRRTR